MIKFLMHIVHGIRCISIFSLVILSLDVSCITFFSPYSQTASSMPIDSFILFHFLLATVIFWNTTIFILHTPRTSSIQSVSTDVCSGLCIYNLCYTLPIRNYFQAIFQLSRDIPVKTYKIVSLISVSLCISVCECVQFSILRREKKMTKRSQSRKMVLASTNLSYRKFCKTIITTAKYLLVSMSIRSYHIMFSFRKVVESIRKEGMRMERISYTYILYSILTRYSKLFECYRRCNIC